MSASVLVVALATGFHGGCLNRHTQSVRAASPQCRMKAAKVKTKPTDTVHAKLAQELAQAELVSSEPNEWRWISGNRRPVPSFDGVLEALTEEVLRTDVEVHVGCDSAVQNGGRVCFATVVCVIARGGGQGGRYFYSRQIEPRRHYPVLATRLLREVELSLQTAEALKAHGINVETVHCDSNTDPTCKSTEHTRMLTGYISSMGYSWLVKPQAWATFVADRHSRGVPTLPRGVRVSQAASGSTFQP